MGQYNEWVNVKGRWKGQLRCALDTLTRKGSDPLMTVTKLTVNRYQIQNTVISRGSPFVHLFLGCWVPIRIAIHRFSLHSCTLLLFLQTSTVSRYFRVNTVKWSCPPEMTTKIDSSEVLFYLNKYGIRSIDEDAFQQFMRGKTSFHGHLFISLGKLTRSCVFLVDLKKLIKHEQRKKKETSERTGSFSQHKSTYFVGYKVEVLLHISIFLIIRV